MDSRIPKEGLICKINLKDGSIDVRRISDKKDVVTDHDKEALKVCADEVFMEGEQGDLFYRKIVDYVDSGMVTNTRIVVYEKRDLVERPDYETILSS